MRNMTSKEFADLMRDRSDTRLVTRAPAGPEKSRGGVAALRRSRVAGQMTKTERLFASRLDQMKAAGLILGYDYECDRLKLAKKIDGGKSNWLKLDFCLYLPNGRMTWVEVKGGFITDAGRLRFRAACERYPHRHLQMWQWKKGAWTLILESGAPARDTS